MAITYGRKRSRQNNVIHTFITAVLLCAIFLTMINYFYKTTEEEAYENLHVQTKHIKDDINLQLTSDFENLATMANFAAKLYKDGEDYNIMFESFKPIGLIANIGILNSDNIFVTKAGSVNLSGRISFEEEKEKGKYISGRVKDLTKEGNEIIRSAVPIMVDGQTVGILYGVIKLDVIGERYNEMAQELDAQLFVYDKENGDLVIDTVHDTLGNISFLKNRKYNDDYTYEKFANTDKGFTSFGSAYRNEDVHMHYSTIGDLGWMIALVRYDSQVFEEALVLSTNMFGVFFTMLAIIVLYMIVIMKNERQLNMVMTGAADVRRILLETYGKQNHILEALEFVCNFAKARSVIFFNTNDEDYAYAMPKYKDVILNEKEKIYFRAELLKYAYEYKAQNNSELNIMCIKPDKHLLKTNHDFYDFLVEHNIDEIAFSAVVDTSNQFTILAVINAKRSKLARMLAERISACFYMALNNKKHLNKTEIAATTDALTEVLNRVAYKNDLPAFDEEKPSDFSCIYIDVNELHLINNKYGHDAGDEMLVYIANTLKKVFYGSKIYRMGGDEFLVFVQDTNLENIREGIEFLEEQLKLKNYHVAIGVSYRTMNTNTEEMVKEAEVKMYEEKAKYYQNKEQETIETHKADDYIKMDTGINEIDTMLTVLQEHYNGIYKVSLSDDIATRILMPSYLEFDEKEENFSRLFTQYVNECVDSDYRRSLTAFLNYDAIKLQLAKGNIPKIKYTKNMGETMILSVYKLKGTTDEIEDTLWVFARN